MEASRFSLLWVGREWAKYQDSAYLLDSEYSVIAWTLHCQQTKGQSVASTEDISENGGCINLGQGSVQGAKDAARPTQLTFRPYLSYFKISVRSFGLIMSVHTRISLLNQRRHKT